MERKAMISMESASALGRTVHSRGLRFLPAADSHNAYVIWEPGLDLRMQTEARSRKFPDDDNNAIFRQLDGPIMRGTLGRE